MTSPTGVLDGYLERMLAHGASDLFLTSNRSPAYRKDGVIAKTNETPPTDAELRAAVDEILTPIARERLAQSPDLDIAHTLPGVGRFRVNLFFHQGKLGVVARRIPLGEITFRDLLLPKSIQELSGSLSGLILVVGPTGCGKSTTIAAILHQINKHRAAHIVTIEDPIEFVHEELRSIVHQRQVGYDTESFHAALRHVVRQNPDVIMIGEMRDRETVETAINAALTGHLILSTLHAQSVVQAVDRILNYFDPAARVQVQHDLAQTLVGFVGMRLLPKASGTGRVPAVEVLRRTPTTRRLITDGDFSGLYDAMKRGESYGMMTMNQSLYALCKLKLVDRGLALRISPNPDELELNLDGMFTGIDSIDLRTRQSSGSASEGGD